MKIRNLYLNLSIKYKLLILFYIIILILSLVFGFYSSSISTKQIRERASTANSEIVKQIGTNIEFLQKDTVDIATYISIDNGIQTILTLSNNKTYATTEMQTYTLNSLKFILNVIVAKEYLSGVVLYNKNGKPVYNKFTDGSYGLSDFKIFRSNAVYEKINQNSGKPFWFLLNDRNNIILKNSTSPKIAMGKVIKNVYNNQTIGYVMFFINTKNIENIYKNHLHSGNENFFILDENQKLICNVGSDLSTTDAKAINAIAEKSKLNTGCFTYSMDHHDELVAFSTLAATNWRIFYLVPMKNMVSQITTIKLFTILIIILTLLFTLPLILIISSYFTSPIKKLLNSMRKFENGNFDEKVFFKYNDEIGELGNGYNNMVENIKELIDKTYKLQIREKDAELSALQAQINPHFLYNTLNLIYYKAEKVKQPEISEMVYLLSQLFRLTLNTGKDWIALDKEHELIYCYLALQAMRFKDRCVFHLEIDDNILNYFIPKLILQPFVENAVIHGISDKAEGGTITVSGKLLNNKIVFTIEDTGIGMSEELVSNLNASIFDNKKSNPKCSGYAIKNVVERLKLTFKDNYSLIFSSSLGKGTNVELIIPIVSELPVKGDGDKND